MSFKRSRVRVTKNNSCYICGRKSNIRVCPTCQDKLSKIGRVQVTA